MCRLPRLTIGEDEELEFVRMIARGRRKDERHARWLGVLMLAGTVFTLLGVIPDIIVREATGWSGHPGLIAGAILAVAASVRALRRLPPLPDDSPV